ISTRLRFVAVGVSPAAWPGSRRRSPSGERQRSRRPVSTATPASGQRRARRSGRLEGRTTLVAKGPLRGVGEKIAECVAGRVLHHERLADPPRQNECDPAVADLLVLAHMREQAVGGYAGEPDRGELRRESHCPEVTAHSL